jgi:hypothetical protein
VKHLEIREKLQEVEWEAKINAWLIKV